MYNVALNKTLFSSGQEFLSALTGPLELSSLPLGLTEQLYSLSSQAESFWSSYERGLDAGYEHNKIFGLAVRSVTLQTLALELVQTFYWVVRMEYYETQKKQMSDAQIKFAAAANYVLERTHAIADRLNKLSVSDDEMTAAASIKRLQYALHLCEVGLLTCQPKGYGHDSWHPNTRGWIGLKARTLRNQAKVGIAAARIAEGELAVLS